MLVLTRKVGEKIVIGDDIVITVCDVGTEKVRLGVQAPREMSVHRGEIVERMKAEWKSIEHSSELRLAEHPAAEEPHE